MDKNTNKEKITKGNIDKYYELVNNKIDYYFDRKVTAKSLLNYFSKDYGMDKFIKREKLDNVEGIKRIIKDVVDDRMALDENVKTFEQYGTKSDDFNLSFDITQDIEKMIADLYRVSLGHIESDKNKIKLQGIKNEQELYVFTTRDLETVYISIANNMYDVFVHEMKFEYQPLDLKINMDIDIIDKEKCVNFFYSKMNSKIIEELLYIETGDVYKRSKLINGILILEKEDENEGKDKIKSDEKSDE